MEKIKDAPVQIFQIKRTSLYQLAYIGDDQYFLYKVYSPLLGFLNWIPYVNLRREAQSINKDISEKYILNEEEKKQTKKEYSNVVLLGGAILPGILSGNIGLYIYGNLGLLFLIFIIIFTLGVSFFDKRIKLHNEMINNFSPNVYISLKNKSFFNIKKMIVYIAVVCMFLMSLSSNIIARIMLVCMFSLVPFALYDFYPDDEELKYTENRIDVLTDIHQNNDKLGTQLILSKKEASIDHHGKTSSVNKTVPLITMSFSDYWDINQNIGHATTHRIKMKVNN
ncbi:hypothetical protein JK159_04195 [Weissella minor]|uniref:hypothetical protein n=1 Tax=Weissella minor TaxID=1620 RepID=UPI001BB09298|nr:hypothetical protein [Weissella minor]MBS0949567.1 hypothetical protein [Weissella minor]